MSQISRRKFITIASASAASTILINACSPPPPPTTTQSPSPATGGSPTQTPAVNIAPGEAPEVTTATLGFIALTDSAPLIIALEKGLFAKHGMADVKVVKQASWPVTRDNLELGSPGGGIDGAHILSPMPYLMSLGTITKGNQPVPMYILARLNTNGQAISLSNDYLPLKLTVKDAAKFKEAVLQAKSGGKEVKAAVTFPGGTHDLWMRYWLASGGMLPDQDIS
ncbi:MAG: CmpA/NrtA family ABC transporter substrate-binding protein, partial [Microcoleaceae cyanobacterium]